MSTGPIILVHKAISVLAVIKNNRLEVSVANTSKTFKQEIGYAGYWPYQYPWKSTGCFSHSTGCVWHGCLWKESSTIQHTNDEGEIRQLHVLLSFEIASVIMTGISIFEHGDLLKQKWLRQVNCPS